MCICFCKRCNVFGTLPVFLRCAEVMPVCLQMSVPVLNVGKTSNKHFSVSVDVSKISALMFQ